MQLPKRKPTRLKGFDYSTAGYYFITICTHERRPIFSRIVGQGLAPAANILSDLGKTAETQLLAIENRYPNVQVHKYIIMPNHIHAIIILGENAEKTGKVTLSDVVCTFKSLTTKQCRKQDAEGAIFQTSFHDHVIRGEQDYLGIWQYIDSNAEKWEQDCFYCHQ